MFLEQNFRILHHMSDEYEIEHRNKSKLKAINVK